MLRRITLLVVALAATIMLSAPGYSAACELVHQKRIKDPPPPPPPNSLCWTGCPLKIQGEQDAGKGRWIFKKESGQNSIQGVWTLETNQNTGITYYMSLERSDIQCPIPSAVQAAIDAGAVDVQSSIGCSEPDLKVKFVKPRVCVDQTANCDSKNQKSVKVFSDWDAVDDLGRGLDVERDGITFSHKATGSYSVYFEECCGDVDDFGSVGDPFELDSYTVLRTPQGDCIEKQLREGARNSGDDLPDPNGIDSDCE